MKQTFFSFLKCCFLSSFMFSCVSLGQNFPSQTSWLKKNETQQKDVKLVLGEPYAIGDSGGIQTWSYFFYKYHLWFKNEHKELKIYWNNDNSVKNYQFTSSFSSDLLRYTKKNTPFYKNSTKKHEDL